MSSSSKSINRIVSACLMIALLLLPSVAGGGGVSEYDLKAAFIYQFTLYVEWPSGAFADGNAPVVIGILGNDPFRGSLDRITSGKTVGSRKIVVKKFSKPSDLQYCQVLFICGSEKKHLSNILQRTSGQSTLTVSDIDRFARDGGVIGLKMADGKVCFDVNQQTAKQVGIKISSKLLRFAGSVY